MLNSLLFILVGLQLPTILEDISEGYSPAARPYTRRLCAWR